MNGHFYGDEYVFALCLLSGGFTGALFDSFKIVRNIFANTFLKNLCDGFFWIFYSVFFAWWIFRINDGELRWFVFAGIIMGAAIYFLLFSKIFVHLGTKIIMIAVKTAEFIVKITVKPVCFILRKSCGILIFAIKPFKKLKRKTVLLGKFLSVKAKNRSFFCKKIRKLQKNTLQ